MAWEQRYEDRSVKLCVSTIGARKGGRMRAESGPPATRRERRCSRIGCGTIVEDAMPEAAADGHLAGV